MYLCRMGKFNKPGRSNSDKKKPSFKSKGGSFKRDKDSPERGEKKDNDGYKEKRSFTKSKDYKNKEGFKKGGTYDKSGADKEKRPFSKSKEFGGKKSFDKSEKRPFSREKRSGDDGYKEKRSFDKDRRDKDNGGFEKKSGDSFVRKDHSDRPERREKRGFGSDKKEGEAEKLSYKERRSFTRNKEFRKSDDFKKKISRSFGDKKEFSNKGDSGHKRPFLRNDKYKDKSDKDNKFKSDREGDSFSRKPFERKNNRDDEGTFDSGEPSKRLKHDDFESGKGFSGGYKKEFSKDKSFDKKSSKNKPANSDGLTRLNKYLANAGIASRRDADILIKSGVVKVNGIPVTEMGYKIKPGDTVTYGDAAVKSERKVYLLLNKPKDYITTMDDPQERKTVMALVSGACKERIYPVGRLDRNTTGLLLFTNDGELTKKLTHPKHEIKKVYHVSLNKSLRGEDFKAIVEGVELEDGLIKADDLAFVGEGKKEVGIEIHSGRNRIVRRLFEHLGYEILKLDRVTFAGLTKKDLPRGKHRFLTQKEVNFLQMIG